jgi:hypothetical protein
MFPGFFARFGNDFSTRAAENDALSRPTAFWSDKLRKWLDSHVWLWLMFLIMLPSAETRGKLSSPMTPIASPTWSYSDNTVTYTGLRYWATA